MSTRTVSLIDFKVSMSAERAAIASGTGSALGSCVGSAAVTDSTSVGAAVSSSCDASNFSLDAASTSETSVLGKSRRSARSTTETSEATSNEKRICDSGASPGEGSVETISPTSRAARESSESPSSKAMISNVEPTRTRWRPRRMFSQSLCSSYSVSARKIDGSRFSPSSSSTDSVGFETAPSILATMSTISC